MKRYAAYVRTCNNKKEHKGYPDAVPFPFFAS